MLCTGDILDKFVRNSEYFFLIDFPEDGVLDLGTFVAEVIELLVEDGFGGWLFQGAFDDQFPCYGLNPGEVKAGSGLGRGLVNGGVDEGPFEELGECLIGNIGVLVGVNESAEIEEDGYFHVELSVDDFGLFDASDAEVGDEESTDDLNKFVLIWEFDGDLVIEFKVDFLSEHKNDNLIDQVEFLKSLIILLGVLFE